MELIKIVDEYGNDTGIIMSRVKAHDLNLLHWEVAIFVINDKKQVLLQKRSANKRFNPNKWAICAGHVTADEELETAAVREVNEEIGLSIVVEDLHLLEKYKLKQRQSNSHITRYYYVTCNNDINEFKIQKEELSEVKWLDIDEVINMIQTNGDSTSLKEDLIYLLEKLKRI